MAFPQTPAHAVPGAFLHTPAVASRFNAQQDPVRRRLFGENAGAGDQVARFGQEPAGNLDAPTDVAEEQALRNLPAQNVPHLPPLTKAATYINDSLKRDSEYPQLDSYCRREPSSSKLHSDLRY